LINSNWINSERGDAKVTESMKLIHSKYNSESLKEQDQIRVNVNSQSIEKINIQGRSIIEV